MTERTIGPQKFWSLISKGSLLEQVKKKTEGEPANLGSHKKQPLKCRKVRGFHNKNWQTTWVNKSKQKSQLTN